MELFEKMGDALNEAGKDITQKVTDLTELTKLKVDIRRREDTARRLYQELGRQYYDLHKEDAEPLFEEVTLITETLKELLKLKKAAAQCKGKRVCPACGTPNDDDAVFCKKCGTKCEDEDMDKAEEGEVVCDAAAEAGETSDAGAEDEVKAEDVEKKEFDL